MEDSDKSDQKIDFNTIREHLKDYINNRIDYLRLTIVENIANAVPVLILAVILTLLFIVFWIFGNIAAVIAIGKMIDSMALGFLIVAGCNLLIGIILLALYKQLLADPIGNMIVKNLTDKSQKDENK
jgi:hypothetical protein